MSATSKKRAELRTWIEIDKEAVEKNYRVFRGLIKKDCKLLAVVKSNAYGHGLIDFSKEMERLGADFLGVDSAVEARALRHHGVKLPILILGYTMPEMIAEMVKDDVSMTVSSFEALMAVAKAKFKGKAKIHIKVDTGMGRQGFLPKDLAKILADLQLTTYNSKLFVEGLYTHFAAAKNPAFPASVKNQLAEFQKWIDAFRAARFKPIVHAAASAGAILFPESHFDMVRIGIGLYGLWPAKEVEAFCAGRIKLEPVLSWRTIVSEVKELPAGSKVGYDSTEILDRKSKIAVCPIGYWHGYPRALSSIGRLLVQGQMSKVIGRVSMDMITIDVTGIPKVAVGGTVTLVGRDGKKSVTLYDLANLLDESWYEVVTRVNPLIKKIYL